MKNHLTQAFGVSFYEIYLVLCASFMIIIVGLMTKVRSSTQKAYETMLNNLLMSFEIFLSEG